MSGKAQTELKQSRPFASEAVEAYVNVLRTADWLLRDTERLLAAEGLTPPQYNVLRILRGAAAREPASAGAAGAHAGGLPCSEIGTRMITRDPDVTRLLDRLEKRRLITRARSMHDRRVILVRITTEGRRLLELLDQPVMDLHQTQMRKLGKQGARALIALLERLREA